MSNSGNSNRCWGSNLVVRAGVQGEQENPALEVRKEGRILDMADLPCRGREHKHQQYKMRTFNSTSPPSAPTILDICKLSFLHLSLLRLPVRPPFAQFSRC